MMSDITDRFDLLIIETAEGYLKRRVKEKAERAKKLVEYKKKIEIECDCFCPCCNYFKPFLRWIYDGEFYCCYNCFLDNLGCEADVMVPMRNITQMDSFLTEGEWIGLWEEENGFND